MTEQQDSKPAKRAVIYLRTRTVGGSDRHVDAQLARQRAACQRIAEAHGATVLHEYAAIGGARDPHVRYIVSAMCHGAAAGQVDYVITTGMDRLCRGPAASNREVLRSIRRTGAALLCGSTWDVTAPGQLIYDALADASRLHAYRRATAGRAT